MTVPVVDQLMDATGVQVESARNNAQDLLHFLVNCTVQKQVQLALVVMPMLDVPGVLVQFNVLILQLVNVSLLILVHNVNLRRIAILALQILNVLGAQIVVPANNKVQRATLPFPVKTSVKRMEAVNPATKLEDVVGVVILICAKILTLQIVSLHIHVKLLLLIVDLTEVLLLEECS